MSTAVLGLTESESAIRDGIVKFTERRDLLSVLGPDARSYLDSQCSQDLSGLSPGESVESLLLSPQGKIDAFVRVLCYEPERFALEVEEGFGSLVEERLRRFKIRVKADLELVTVELERIVGPLVGDEYREVGSVSWPGPFVVPLSWPGLSGIDRLGMALSEISLGDPVALEVARIEAGMPKMASELSGGVIPQAAGIADRAVSFSKGCYTGQELVARLDARGANTPTQLRGLVVVGSDLCADDMDLNAPVLFEGSEVGRLTSVAHSDRRGGIVALGYFRRAVVPPAPAEVYDRSGAAHHAEVVVLPIFGN